MSNRTIATVGLLVAGIVSIGVLVQSGWLGTQYADQAVGVLLGGAGGAGVGWWARGVHEHAGGDVD